MVLKTIVQLLKTLAGLEEDKITWYSNAIPTSFQIWEAEKITGFSNTIIGCLIWEMSFGGR